jgi:hypothetical protein
MNLGRGWMNTEREYLVQTRTEAKARNDRGPTSRVGPCSERRTSARSLWLLLPLTFFSLLLCACPLYNPAAFIQHRTAQDQISINTSQATLQWDPPPSGASAVVSYMVSYRIHGTSTWNTLASVPASSQPEYTVLRSALGIGSFDFAVVAVDLTGASSPLHTSLDPTADPTSGWYLTWGP